MKNNNWIFIRGLTRGNAHWGEFPQILKQHVHELNTEFLEIPGNGSLNNIKTPLNACDVVRFLQDKSVMYAQNLPVNICGISLGGMIALKWAEMDPQNVQSVVIINSSLSQCSSIFQRIIPKNYYRMIKAVLSSNIAEQESAILEMTSNHLDKTKKYIESFVEFSSKYPVLRENFLRQLILASRIRIDKWPSHMPLKIISSQMDRLVDSSCSDEMAIYLKGTQYIHMSAGHDLPLDDPQWLAEILTS